MNWFIRLWWNFTLGCVFIFKAYVGWWADHLPHSPVCEEVRSDQPQPIQDVELVSYAELEGA